MAMGRVSVVSDSTAQADLVNSEHCGLIHKAADVGDLSEKISILYKDARLREEMGNNARAAVLRKWNWETSSGTLTGMYSTLAER